MRALDCGNTGIPGLSQLGQGTLGHIHLVAESSSAQGGKSVQVLSYRCTCAGALMLATS